MPPHKMVQQVWASLLVPIPEVLRQGLVIGVGRRLLHHLLNIPAFHYVVAGSDGVRRPPDRGRLQPTGRGASLPACPLRPASCPEDRDWKRVLQDRALVGAKVAGVPDRPGLTWLLGTFSGPKPARSSALGLLVQTEAWPPGTSREVGQEGDN